VAQKKSSKAKLQHDQSKKIEFDPKLFGFTLAGDEKVLADLERIEAETVKAAQKPHRFAWR
jgi:hypothetical protein